MTNPYQNEPATKFMSILFWLLWVLFLVLIPLYGFTFFFEISVVKSGKISSYISPIIGIFVLLAQIAIAIISFKQFRKNDPLPKVYLTLLGASIILALAWAGGCTLMGPWNIH